MKISTTKPNLLTAADVAEYLQVSEVTVRRLIRQRSVGVIRFGRSVRVDPAELDRFVSANSTAAR